MLDFFKNVFQRRPVRPGLGQDASVPQSLAESASPAPEPSAVDDPPSAPRPARSEFSNSVEVSLQTVFAAFPSELKNRIKQADVGQATVTIPLDKILPQLALGTVRLSFGELRRAAPQLFFSGTDRDPVHILLPLNEILVQINPALLPRRHNQKQIAVPDEIKSPFGDHGKGLAFAVAQAKSQTTVAARAVTPTAPSPAAPVQARSAPAAPAAPSPLQPTKPAAARFPFTQPSPPRSPIAPAPPVARPAGPPAAGAVPPAPRNVGAAPPPQVTREPGLPRSPGAPREPVSQLSRVGAEAGALITPLMNLAEGWPEALRYEITQSKLGDAKLALPLDVAEEALKRGRVAFPWIVLRSWIKPAPAPSVSVHDNTVLELPLKVIATLFLGRHKETGKAHQKVALDENIPNLFFGFPQPGAPSVQEAAASDSHAVTRPVDTNYYVWDETPEAPKAEEVQFKREPESPSGTSFITRCATPNEVVSRAAALDGVAGALIALPDGLMVASRLSPDLNGDTLAAFLPQIFGKVNQCTKELRMGELNNLSFTVGNVPWKIFRVNAIFFAVFGRPGQPLPAGQLVSLAAELDRKKQ